MFEVDVVMIGQGEFYTSSRGEILCTVLGSCVSVCLFDEHAKIGGLNHYLLPEPVMESDKINWNKAKYGVNAIELLINELLSKGAKRENLKAKIFGGAKMFEPTNESNEIMTVGKENIEFIRKYLKTEKISIISEDVGGVKARKIYLDTGSNHVKLFRIKKSESIKLIESEFRYRKDISEEGKTEKKKDKKITFF